MTIVHVQDYSDGAVLPDGYYVKHADYEKLRKDAVKLATLFIRHVNNGCELTLREQTAGISFMCNGEVID